VRIETSWVAATLLVAFLGCAYELVGSAAVERRVSLRTLANDTLEPGVELMVSDALRYELTRSGHFRLVEDPAVADVTIAGRVRALQTTSRSFSAAVRAVEYSVAMHLELDVSSRDGTRVQIDPNSLSESEIYLASADLEVSRKNREEALRRLAALLAARIYDELLLATPVSVGTRGEVLP
jgi:hypothetical protein